MIKERLEVTKHIIKKTVHMQQVIHTMDAIAEYCMSCIVYCYGMEIFSKEKIIFWPILIKQQLLRNSSTQIAQLNRSK